MILQEKIKKKTEGFGKLSPVFLEGAEFALENQWISVDEGKIELSPDMYPHSETTPKEYYLEKDYFFFDAALESFEFAFADGTPFGIKKEE